MSKTARFVFTILLVMTCCVVYFWQHFVTNLIYLPKSWIVTLAILTPALLALTFFTTYALMYDTRTRKPILRSCISTAAMLLPILIAGLHLLNYAACRYAGVLPVYPWFDLPVGIVMNAVSALLIVHLTALLICRLIKTKAKALRIILSSIGWIALNGCLWLITV